MVVDHGLVDGTSALSPIEIYKSITGSSIWLTRRKYKLNMVEIWLQSGYSLLRSVENSPAVLSPSAFEDACKRAWQLISGNGFHQWRDTGGGAPGGREEKTGRVLGKDRHLQQLSTNHDNL